MNDEPIFSFESPDDSPGFLLWQVTNLWQRQIKNGLSELGLTHVQFVLLASLAWLAGEGQVVTQASLAAYAKTDVMMTSTVLRTLEERGLVRRDPHPTDTRARSLSLTEAAWPLIQRAVQRVEQIDRHFFASLGAQLGDFNEALKHLLAQERGSPDARSKGHLR